MTPSVKNSSGSTTSSAAGGLVDPHGGSVTCDERNGEAVISQYKQPGQPKEQVLTFNRAKALPGWQLEDAVCASPLAWAPDFSRYLVAGKPPGTQVNHVVDIDVKTGAFTDLTEPRQKTGFSDPVLYENRPSYVSDMPSDKATFGSNLVLMDTNNGGLLVDRRSPETATPVPDSTTWVGSVPPGHPEAILRGNGVGIQGRYGELSPDGTYRGERNGFRRNSQLDVLVTVECPELMAGFGDFLGWADATHLILTDNRQVSLVTASDKPTCEPLIPKTDKEIRGVMLSEDGSKLHFKASNTNGGTTDYSVPISSPGAEPITDPFPKMIFSTLYRPGNY